MTFEEEENLLDILNKPHYYQGALVNLIVKSRTGFGKAN